MLQVLERLLEQRHLCDVTLVAGEREFAAHRVVLAAGSPYFHAMFTNAHMESRQDRIVLNGIEASSLENILTFIYSASLEITETNVQNLLAAASLLQLTPVIEACCSFLKVRLEPENCIGIASFADMHGCKQLSQASWNYALQNFKTVSFSDEFLSAPSHVLQELLCSENLNVRSEENVLDAVMRWFRHDESSRLPTVASLLQVTKLPIIPMATLLDKLGPLASHPNCQDLIQSAQAFQSKSIIPAKVQQTDSLFNMYTPRKSIKQKREIYLVGGETYPGRTTVDTVEVFNPRKNSWRSLACMGQGRRGVGVGVLNGVLYAVGGSDGVQALKIVECFNQDSNSWTRVADMNEPRSSVAAAVMEDALYAVGGYDGIMSCLSSVERYSPQTDKWSYIHPMSIPRSMTTVGILCDQLYVVGGYNGSSDLSSCEVYDPTTDSWRNIPDMSSNRCMAGVGVVKGRLFVAGGCDYAKSLRTMEVYDPQSNTWTMAAEMSEARSGVGVAVVQDKLYALGGYSGTSYCSSVECYDMDSDQWSCVSNMELGRRRFGCCS